MSSQIPHPILEWQFFKHNPSTYQFPVLNSKSDPRCKSVSNTLTYDLMSNALLCLSMWWIWDIVSPTLGHVLWRELSWLLLSWLSNVTINGISVIYVTAHRCPGVLKKKLTYGRTPRHRYLVGFFSIAVQTPTRATLFIRLCRETAPFSRL